MACEHNWTFRFPEINDGEPFEIAPVSMDLKLSRQEYDFCRAKFFYTVGEEMKPETERDGVLNGLTPVDACYNGQPVKRLLFRPDWVTYNDRRTEIEFHDIHKALSDVRVDIQRFKVKLKDIYKEVINSPGNNIIPEITDDNFLVADDRVDTLYGDVSDHAFIRQNDGKYKTKKALESENAVDFDNISAEEAVARLNEKFGLRSWSTADGELMIGVPEENQIRHVAAESDPRVWKYKNPSINHGREPVKRVLVEGPWVDEPGIGDLSEGFQEVKSWFTDDEQGSADVRAYGIAERTDIDYGTQFMVKVSEATVAGLPEIATLALEKKMKSQNAGTVEIDTELSGTEVSEPVEIQPGDTIQLVPRDDNFQNPTVNSGELGDKPADRDESCGSFVHNEAYLVSDVNHQVSDSGRWTVNAQIAMYPDVPTENGIAYFEPSDREWLESSKIASDGELKGGYFETI